MSELGFSIDPLQSSADLLILTFTYIHNALPEPKGKMQHENQEFNPFMPARPQHTDLASISIYVNKPLKMKISFVLF